MCSIVDVLVFFQMRKGKKPLNPNKKTTKNSYFFCNTPITLCFFLCFAVTQFTMNQHLFTKNTSIKTTQNNQVKKCALSTIQKLTHPPRVTY